MFLTHWGRDTHICVGKLTIIVSDNGLSPGRRQAIIWTNAGILLIGNLGTNFNEIAIGIQTFSFRKMHLNMSSARWRPFCLGLNELIRWWTVSLDIRIYAVPHRGGVTHICTSKLSHHWFRQWLVAYPASSHCLTQRWLIVNWNIGNKLLWNLNQNTPIFIQENGFENVCEMAAILSRGNELNTDICLRHRLPRV